MPHIRVRGAEAGLVLKLSESLHHELATLLSTPADHFTFELVQTQFFSQGRAGGESPFIEVLWFDRGPDMKKAVALRITDSIRKHGGSGDIAVVFQTLDPKNYFENGKHF